MSDQYLRLNDAALGELEIQSPPTINRTAQTNEAALRKVIALNSGDSPADVTFTLVQEEAEGLLKKNAADYAMLLRDHKSAIESLKEAIAKQKQVTASLEATLAILEGVHGA
ncbi:hypothetical protein D9757_005113 [Collybiopsis confluens]|uniref:Uncharacterized protein n=1 Tax=Collybiopsis confluens TaxID=2823264 RepID=A0A8H5HSZ3_9AGAR|nr:hypothetical protein D9757_005113 [Collybiopsis confluens]